MVDQELVLADPHRVPVHVPEVALPGDPPRQGEVLLGEAIGLDERRRLAPEAGHHGAGVSGRAVDAVLGEGGGEGEAGLGGDVRAGHEHRPVLAPYVHRVRVLRPHEGGDERRPRALVDLLRGADLGDPPGVEDHHAVGHGHGLLAVVGHEDGGEAEALLEASHLVAHVLPDPRVEVRERLVEEEDGRIDGEGAGEGDALALPAGKARHVAPLEALEPDEGDQLPDPFRDAGLRPAANAKPVADVLGRVHVRPQGVGLEHHRHVPPLGRERSDWLPADLDPAGGDGDEAREGAQQRRLAAAGGPEEGDELARGDGEVDVVEDRDVAVGDVQALDPDRQAVHVPRPPVSGRPVHQSGNGPAAGTSRTAHASESRVTI